MEHLISQYIDDELSLAEKIEFVRTEHGDAAFTEEAVALLAQETLLRGTLAAKARGVAAEAAFDLRPPVRFPPGLLRWSGWAVAALLLFVLAGTVLRGPAVVVELSPSVAGPATRLHRFVIFKPGITSAEISGPLMAGNGSRPIRDSHFISMKSWRWCTADWWVGYKK